LTGARCGVTFTADIELMRPDQVNEALDRLARNDVRHRFVLDVAHQARGASAG
jgi:cinnamyl-alcohol dehydrogenase